MPTERERVCEREGGRDGKSERTGENAKPMAPTCAESSDALLAEGAVALLVMGISVPLGPYGSSIPRSIGPS